MLVIVHVYIRKTVQTTTVYIEYDGYFRILYLVTDDASQLTHLS